jgi:hypothetical protein
VAPDFRDFGWQYRAPFRKAIQADECHRTTRWGQSRCGVRGDYSSVVRDTRTPLGRVTPLLRFVAHKMIAPPWRGVCRYWSPGRRKWWTNLGPGSQLCEPASRPPLQPRANLPHRDPEETRERLRKAFVLAPSEPDPCEPVRDLLVWTGGPRGLASEVGVSAAAAEALLRIGFIGAGLRHNAAGEPRLNTATVTAGPCPFGKPA